MFLFALCFFSQINNPGIRLADSLFEAEEYSAAQEIYLKNLADGDQADSGWIFKGLGNCAFVQGSFTKAQNLYVDALEIFEKTGDNRGMVKVLNNLGQIHGALGEPEKAIKLYDQALQFSDRILSVTKDDNVDRIALLGNTGQALQALHQIDGAKEKYLTASEIARSIPYEKGIADNFYNYAVLLQVSGEVDSATIFYQAACSIYSHLDQLKSAADCYREIGNIFRVIGDYSTSIEYIQKALEIFRSYYSQTNEMLLGHAELLNNLSLVYLEIGEYSTALEGFLKAQKKFESIGDIAGVGVTLQNRAAVYLEYALHDSAYYDSAGSMYDIAAKYTKNPADKAILLNHHGILSRRLGHYQEADNAFAKALELLDKNDKLNRIKLLNNMGNNAFSQRDYQLALEYYTEAYSHAIIQSHKTWEAALLSNIGMTYHALKKTDEAIKSLTRAAFIIEEIRGLILSQEYRSEYFEDKVVIYEELMSIMYEKGDTKQTFLYAEQAKARAFLDLIAGVDFSERHDISPDIRALIQTEQRLERKIEYLNGDPSQNQAISELKKVIEQLQHVFPEYYALKNIVPARIEEIQGVLDRETAVIEYFIGSRSSYIFSITDRTITVHALTVHPEIIYRTVDSLVRTIRRRKDFSVYGTWLFDNLIKPVQSSLTGKKRICFIPHGILHHLPFATLIDEQDRLLIEQFNIFYAPSASVFALVHERGHTLKQGVVIFAKSDFSDHEQWQNMPLPGTQIEKDSLVSSGGFNSIRIYADSEGPAFQPTEANIKAVTQDFDIIHCATHGQLIYDSPMDSKIVLSAGDEEDGNLTVREIFNMDFNAYLVTLSACETGKLRGFNERTRYSAGDDLTGLTRAFLYAGASSVVASLWKVHDLSTALMMTRFYKNLGSMDKVEALCEAQRWLLHSDELYYFNKPFFWAPFVVFGDWQ